MLPFCTHFSSALLLSHLPTVCLFAQEGGVRVALTAEQVDHHFICTHHDGGVGNLSDEVGGEAAVQRPVSFLPGYCQESLEEGAIPAAFLS